MNSSDILITVGREHAGQRLDQFIAARVDQLSRSRVKQLISDGCIRVNATRVKPSYKLRPGDRIEGYLPTSPSAPPFSPEPIPLDILFEDEDLIVINKPAGLIVHPGAGARSGTLANALAYHFQRLSGLSGPTRPGIVHRLDKDTSGLMIVAKHDRAHQKLAVQWQRRTVEKTYIGLVYGHPAPEQGKIEAPIGRHPFHRTKMAVRPEEKGRPALTLYRVIERFPDAALLELRLKTGRTHQIRVHLRSIHHPIVGDRVYGAGYKTKMRDPVVRQAIDRLHRHFLHAAGIRFHHPRTGDILEFHAPLPAELEEFLALLRRRVGSETSR